MFGKTAVPQPPCCLNVPGWMWDSSLLRESWVPGFIVYRAHYYVTRKHLDLCLFFSQIIERERKHCVMHSVFRGRRMRWGRGVRQVPTCRCAWSRWQQRCGCIPASGRGSAPGKPSQMSGMEPDHQNESVQTQSPHCSLSRCPLLWSKKSHLTFTNVYVPISLSVSLPFQPRMPPPHSD